MQPALEHKFGAIVITRACAASFAAHRSMRPIEHSDAVASDYLFRGRKPTHVAANIVETARWAGSQGLPILRAANIHPLSALPLQTWVRYLDARFGQLQIASGASGERHDVSYQCIARAPCTLSLTTRCLRLQQALTSCSRGL